MRRTEQQRGAREFLRQPVLQRAEGESYVGEAPAHSPWGHQRWPSRISFPGCWVLTASIYPAKFS